ncbi:MAG: nucleotidyltransferase domain-containing protein [Bacteroidales bacterium]|nr:nucleotidyltransferase domain-containing protein [Bacteroidales bacterium]
MNENRKYGLRETDVEKLIDILASNSKISKIILFGSRAKGNFREGADIDISLAGNNLNLDDIIDAKLETDQLNLPYKIDLVIYERIKENALKEHIDRVGIVLFDREKALQ